VFPKGVVSPFGEGISVVVGSDEDDEGRVPTTIPAMMPAMPAMMATMTKPIIVGTRLRWRRNQLVLAGMLVSRSSPISAGDLSGVCGTETAASALSDSFALHDIPAAQAATTEISTTAARLSYS